MCYNNIMSEIKIKGIVISSKDFKEYDKIITIYSLEKGIVYAKLTGVKKPKAKLKTVKDVFCFAEFILVSKNSDFYTVSSANVLESFYGLSKDIAKFNKACLVLKILNVIGKENDNNEMLFLQTLKTLKLLAYSSVNENLILAKYLLTIFKSLGYVFSLLKCPKCGLEIKTIRYFSVREGVITCSACKTFDAIKISELLHNSMRLISNCEFEKLCSLKILESALLEIVQLLLSNFEERFDCKLNFTL